jgi:hypothetical protein
VVLALAIGGIVLAVRQPELSRRTSDFTIGYGVGTMIRSGQASDVYDQARLGTVLQHLTPGEPIDPRLPFNQPLAAGLIFVPLSLLPIDVAFRVWQLAGAGILLLACFCLQSAVRLPGRAPWLGWVALLASAPAWATLTEGQLTPFLVLGAALLLVVGSGKQVALAAAGGALLAIKPQYLPAYVLVLVAQRRWTGALAALAGGGAILLSPLAAGGPNALVAMAHSAFAGDQLVPLRLMEGWVGPLASVLPGAVASRVGLVLFGLTTAILAAIAWRRPVPAVGTACLFGCLAILGSPHSLPHDLILLAVPAWLSVSLFGKGLVPSPLAGLALVDLALLIDLRGTPVTLGPIFLTAAVVVYGLQFRRRWAQRAQPLPAAA